MSNKISRLITMLLVMSSFFVAAQNQSSEALALETYADTLVAREDFAGAIKIYDKLIDKSRLKTEEDYRVLYKRAYAYFGAKNFQKSLQDVNQYIAKIQDPQAKLLRIYINRQLGDDAAQLTDLNEFLKENPDNPELLRWRASVYMDAENYKLAQKDIRALLAQQPSPEVEAYLGLTYYYQNNPDSALMVFDHVIAQQPSFIQSYLYAGSMCLEQEAYPLALEYINKGLKQDPSNATLLFYKGAALVEVDKTDEGCRCLRKAFEAGMDEAADYLKEYCYGVH
ncbi:tetratricopeptide repeat protein [Ohtaekwangia sp.]|uniref:tetratricopeptide repeat protein n=1 Tax=Ohtaekwangia sp. TaxID=2066019 RepID=UPI002F938D05